MSRFPLGDVASLPDDLRSRLEEVTEKSGFLPNVFAVMAHRPAELRAFLAYHDATMEGTESLSAADREMIVVATSAARDCTYCVVAHGAILRVRARDPLLADLVATNYRHAPLSDRQRAMLDYAVKLSLTPELVEQADLDGLFAAGFSQDDAWDISAVVSFFALSNRMALATGMMPNPEFHLMGRLPR